MKKILFSTICVLLFSSACALIIPIKLNTRFDAIGPVQDGQRGPIVEAPKDVEVYYASSPEGFSLKENELKVESGFGHKIVGRLQVLLANDGGCMAKPVPSKKLVLEDLRHKAYKIGANAVIYASSELPSEEDYSSDYRACDAISAVNKKADRSVGFGWAVVLEKPADSKGAGQPESEAEAPSEKTKSAEPKPAEQQQK